MPARMPQEVSMPRSPKFACAAIAAIPLLLAVGFPACTGTPGAGGLPFNLPPTPVITTDLVRGVAPLTVQFNSDRSSDDGLIVSREWDFGDGTTSLEISPSHTFTTTGDYVVTLTLTDDSDATASTTVTIAVTEAPVAVISADPESAESAPASIDFDGSASFDPDGEIVEYEWNFGDGSTESLMTLTHVYASAGAYRAKLTVTDDKGVTGSAEKLISIGIPIPTIEIRVPPQHADLLLERTSVNAVQVREAVHTLEVVGDDNGRGWGSTAVNDIVVFDTDGANVSARVTALNVGQDSDVIRVTSLEGSASFAALNKPARVYAAASIVVAPESPLWIQAVYDVEPGVARFTRAGIDRDRDQCEAQAVIYDVGNGATVSVLEGHDDRVNDVAYTTDGNYIATCSDDGTVRVYGAANFSLKATYSSNSAINAIAFSPDDTRLALAQENGDVVLTDFAATDTVVSVTLDRSFSSHTAAVNDVAFSPDGTQVLSGADDRRAILWSVADGSILRDSPHTLGVNAVAFSPRDPILVATAGEEGNIRLWNNTSGMELTTVIGHEGPVNDVVFSPDGLALFTASDDNTARAWDPFTGALAETFTGHTDDVISVAISTDGTRLITGSSDFTARVWDAVTTETLLTVQPCVSTINAVQFAPDDARFVIGVAAHNDLQLDTDPPNGNDLNITLPQALSLQDVFASDGSDFDQWYNLWAEIRTDQSDVPVRTYAEAGVYVVDEFAATLADDPPTIPLSNGRTWVVMPHARPRQIFDLGPVEAGDRLYVSLLSTPGFGEVYQSNSDFSIMLLDANSRIFAWYQPEFILFTPDTKLVVGDLSRGSHMYVVADGGIGVSVRVQTNAASPETRRQRVFLDFDGSAAIGVGGEPPRIVPPLDAADFNQFFTVNPNWGDVQTAALRAAVVDRIRQVYSDFDVTGTAADQNVGIEFFNSNDDDPANIGLPYLTVYVGGANPDLATFGISDYIDPRNETTTGSAIIYATNIARVGIQGGFVNPVSSVAELGNAIGMTAAHELGHLLGLRHTDDPTDLMGPSDPTDTSAALKGDPGPLVAEDEQFDNLDAIGRQNAILLLTEAVGTK